jgi:hypothetical protein
MRLANVMIRPWYALDSRYHATAALLQGKNSLVPSRFEVSRYATQRKKFPGTQIDSKSHATAVLPLQERGGR